MKKIIFIIPAMFLLSGCLQFWTDPKGYFAGYKPSDMEFEIAQQCEKEAEKKYANDTSEDVGRKISDESHKCYTERIPWWW